MGKLRDSMRRLTSSDESSRLGIQINDSFFNTVVPKVRELRMDEIELAVLSALLFWTSGKLLK